MLRQRHYPVDVLHAEVVEGLLRVRARLVPPDEYPLGREHHHEEQQEGLAAVEGNQGRALQDVRFGVLQSGNLDKGQEDDHDGVQREHLERGALEHLHRKGHLLRPVELHQQRLALVVVLSAVSHLPHLPHAPHRGQVAHRPAPLVAAVAQGGHLAAGIALQKRPRSAVLRQLLLHPHGEVTHAGALQHRHGVGLGAELGVDLRHNLHVVDGVEAEGGRPCPGRWLGRVPARSSPRRTATARRRSWRETARRSGPVGWRTCPSAAPCARAPPGRARSSPPASPWGWSWCRTWR
eukprot:1176503-Prorocentrum_minimum.AAC.1